MARLRIGLIGWGTVGSALGRLVSAGPLPLELACVAVRNPAAARGIPLPDGVAVVAPEDVVTTVYAKLGIDGDKQYQTPQNRPIKIVTDGEPIKELAG